MGDRPAAHDAIGQRGGRGEINIPIAAHRAAAGEVHDRARGAASEAVEGRRGCSRAGSHRDHGGTASQRQVSELDAAVRASAGLIDQTTAIQGDRHGSVQACGGIEAIVIPNQRRTADDELGGVREGTRVLELGLATLQGDRSTHGVGGHHIPSVTTILHQIDGAGVADISGPGAVGCDAEAHRGRGAGAVGEIAARSWQDTSTGQVCKGLAAAIEVHGAAEIHNQRLPGGARAQRADAGGCGEAGEQGVVQRRAWRAKSKRATVHRGGSKVAGWRIDRKGAVSGLCQACEVVNRHRIGRGADAERSPRERVDDGLAVERVRGGQQSGAGARIDDGAVSAGQNAAGIELHRAAKRNGELPAEVKRGRVVSLRASDGCRATIHQQVRIGREGIRRGHVSEGEGLQSSTCRSRETGKGRNRAIIEQQPRQDRAVCGSSSTALPGLSGSRGGKGNGRSRRGATANA